MMGIRTAFKEDLQATPAELVYGETLRLPGEFLQETQDTKISISDILLKLKNTMRDLRPQHCKRHESNFEYKNLKNSTHVFLRNDASTRALQPTYEGPYQVLNRSEKVYKLWINGKTVHVTIDRLKPAYIMAGTEPVATPTKIEKKTDSPSAEIRSGRVFRKIVRFQSPN